MELMTEAPGGRELGESHFAHMDRQPAARGALLLLYPNLCLSSLYHYQHTRQGKLPNVTPWVPRDNMENTLQHSLIYLNFQKDMALTPR